MSEFPPNDRTDRSHHSSENGSSKPRPAASILDLLSPDDPLQKEMEKMLAQDPSFKNDVENVASEKPPRPRKAPPPPQSRSEPQSYADSDQMMRLERENAMLRKRVEELEQVVEMTSSQSDSIWSEQQREYEAMLEEKSETIRALYQKIQKYKDKYAAAKSSLAEQEPMDDLGPSGGSDNPLAVRQEIAALRAQLERERMQLREDELALEEQMKQMEISMSKERVELARQKNELQRMYQDFQHEIDNSGRGNDLRERLAQIQQQRRPDSSPGGSGFQPRQAAPTQQSLPNGGGQAPQQGGRPKSSSFFGRIFKNDQE